MFQERATPRHEVLVEAKIMSPDLASCIACVINEVSDGGARITIAEEVKLAGSVYLWQAETGTTIECQVNWRKPGSVGLQFARPNAPAVRALTRICTPLSQRVLPMPLRFPRVSITVPSPAAAARFMVEAC